MPSFSGRPFGTVVAVAVIEEASLRFFDGDFTWIDVEVLVVSGQGLLEVNRKLCERKSC